MKVGIITFHRAINYGGVLQAYALQRVISDLEIECDIIDYYCPFIEAHYRPKKITKMQIKRLISTLLFNGELKRSTDEFENFINHYLKLSSKKYSPQTIVKANREYDYFLTGSDQVWSPTCAGFDNAYFLDFVIDINKKGAYAASFGRSDIPEELKSEYTRLLKDFNSISVREKSGVNIVNQLTNLNATVVLDPTLLLSKEQWENNFNKKRFSNYILVYMISEDKDLLKKAKEYSKEHHLQIVYINNRLYKTKNVTNISKVSPEEWVSLFINAECIFTNSFHGIAFSINFSKLFFAYELKENKSVNERIINILSLFDLTEHLINKETDIKGISEIDYQQIQMKLDKLRKESMKYLRKILRGISNELI